MKPSTLTKVSASVLAVLVLAACDNKNTENKVTAAAKPQAEKTFVNCVSRSPTGFSPILMMDGLSYNASSQQIYNRLVSLFLAQQILNLH